MPSFEVRTPDSTFNAADYDPACVRGKCDCAPPCPACGMKRDGEFVKMWDSEKFPGWHDFNCNECHKYSEQNGTLKVPWKEAETKHGN